MDVKCETKNCNCNDILQTYWKSDKYKYIWVEIPKCACTTLKAYLPDKKRELKQNVKNNYNDYFKFAVIRNPWDRLASCYHCFIRTPYGNFICKDFFGISFMSDMSFEDFVIFSSKNFNHHWGQCVSFIDNLNLDRIVIFKNFQEEIDFIKNKLNFEEYCKININNNNICNYKQMYNEKTKKIVDEMFKDDIFTFSFSF